MKPIAFVILKSTLNKYQRRTSLFRNAVHLNGTKSSKKKPKMKFQKFVSYQQNVLNNTEQKAAT